MLKIIPDLQKVTEIGAVTNKPLNINVSNLSISDNALKIKSDVGYSNLTLETEDTTGLWYENVPVFKIIAPFGKATRLRFYNSDVGFGMAWQLQSHGTSNTFSVANYEFRAGLVIQPDGDFGLGMVMLDVGVDDGGVFQYKTDDSVFNFRSSVNGDIKVKIWSETGNIHTVGDISIDDNKNIWLDTAKTKSLLWSSGNSRFEVNDTLYTSEDLKIETGKNIYFGTETLQYNGTDVQFNFSKGLSVPSGEAIYLDGSTKAQPISFIGGKIKIANLSALNGASGSFTTTDAKTVTVVDGIITSIV